MRTLVVAASAALLAALAFAGCGSDDGGGSPASVIAYDADAIQAGNLGHGCLDPDVDAHVAALLAQMTLAEKISQMHGASLAGDITYTEPIERLGIPGFRMSDGPRGAKPSPGTTMPVGIGRGATWDTALEKRVGEVMGAEAKAKGLHVLLAPTIEPVRHPRWGRTQETYGEDPLLVARMGASFISGVQQHVLASAKHFAANNIENTRFVVSANIDERTLQEIYLPSFKSAVVDAGVGSVMSAYNKVNGDFCSQNTHLLRDILKGQWGFKGFVESDWVLGTRSTAPAANAGLDMEMPAPFYFGERLLDAVTAGEVDESVIDEAVSRTLRQKLCFGVRAEVETDPEVIESAAHVEVALESARNGIVLLKNAGLLPLDRQTVGSLAVIGDLADFENLGDFGSSRIAPSQPSTTVVDGLRQIAQGVTLHHIDADVVDPQDADAVASAGAAIVVVGNTWRDEGEDLSVPDPETGDLVKVGDRVSLQLSPAHEALIKQVAALNPRTIVVLEGSGPFSMNAWLGDVAALLTAWYPGMRGGQALAEILFGLVNPSGKLPLTFPVSEEQLPPFDNRSRQVSFDAYHGYRFVDRNGTAPQFPFGFGLSYTTFAYDNLRIDPPMIAAGERAEVSVDVTNTGERAGDEVVQLYVSYQGSAVERAVKELKGFGRVALEAGETKRLVMEIDADQLAYFDVETNSWRVEALQATIALGASSRDLRLEGTLELR